MDQNLQKDLMYLQNFWAPAPRDLVQLPSGIKTRVDEVLDGGTQLITDCNGQVFFCSELDWIPEDKDIPRLLQTRGFDCLPEEGLVTKNGLLFAAPRDISELADLIRSDRVVLASLRRPECRT